MPIPFFRIIYSTTFTILALLLALLLLVTPTDLILQSYRANQLWSILIIAATSLLTLLAAALLYSSRLYANKLHLAKIPRPDGWKEGCPRYVRAMVEAGVRRCAGIADELRPKGPLPRRRPTENNPHPHPRPRSPNNKNNDTNNNNAPPENPAHAQISHPGWLSPSSPDLPNVQFAKVIPELPHLIEAKAVSLAPADPLSLSLSPPSPSPSLSSPLPFPTSPLPDTLIVQHLQRPARTDLRQYIHRLISLAMIPDPTLGETFITLYERARFAGPLVEGEFRLLMDVFGAVLGGMRPLDEGVCERIRDLEGGGRTGSGAGSIGTGTMGTGMGTGSRVSVESRESMGSGRSGDTVSRVLGLDADADADLDLDLDTDLDRDTELDGFEDGTVIARDVSVGSLAGSEGTVRSRVRARCRDSVSMAGAGVTASARGRRKVKGKGKERGKGKEKVVRQERSIESL